VSTAPADTRPRYFYRLLDGQIVPIIHDHGEEPRSETDFALKNGGGIVKAELVKAARDSQPLTHEAMLIAAFDAVASAGGTYSIHEDKAPGAMLTLLKWARATGRDYSERRLELPRLTVAEVGTVSVYAAEQQSARQP
jgi:hypothetical protein